MIYRRDGDHRADMNRNPVSITVTVRLGLLIRAKLPDHNLSVSLPAEHNSIKHLLKMVANQTGGKIDRFLFEKDARILSGLMVKINEEIYTGTEMNQKDIAIENGDIVDLLYYISGG